MPGVLSLAFYTREEWRGSVREWICDAYIRENIDKHSCMHLFKAVSNFVFN